MRVHSFSILSRFPDTYNLFNDSAFVNQVLLKAASELANNPKAMMAEASALFHNLLFRKCLGQLSFLQTEAFSTPTRRQLGFLNYIVTQLRDRVKTF